MRHRNLIQALWLFRVSHTVTKLIQFFFSVKLLESYLTRSHLSPKKKGGAGTKHSKLIKTFILYQTSWWGNPPWNQEAIKINLKQSSSHPLSRGRFYFYSFSLALITIAKSRFCFPLVNLHDTDIEIISKNSAETLSWNKHSLVWTFSVEIRHYTQRCGTLSWH